MNVWEKLETVRYLSFTVASQSHSHSGWQGVGEGEVHTHKKNDNVLIFEENGSWTSKEGKEFTFTNVFRWTLDKFHSLITLEHLRFGEDHPVFLLQLAQSGDGILESVSSHVCEDDTYLGQLVWVDPTIKLNWRIIGPKKNEEISYTYR